MHNYKYLEMPILLFEVLYLEKEKDACMKFVTIL